MQQFAIPRQYMSKNHHFHMLWCCTFILGVSKLVCCYVQKSKVQYSCNIKGTCVPCNILFTEFSLDKKITKVWRS